MEVYKKNRYLIIILEGEFDQHMADQIRGQIDCGLLQEGVKHMVFDFSKVSFMDSSGIGMILKRYKQVKQLGGKLYIVGCSPNLLRLIKLSGLEKLIVLQPSFPMHEI